MTGVNEEFHVKNPRKFVVITHVLFRNGDPVEGPYSSVITALIEKFPDIETIKIPLVGYEDPILYGKNSEHKITLPAFLGEIAPIKYFLDFFLGIALIVKFCIENPQSENIVIGIDPLSTTSAIMLKWILGYKLIFYSVDFNETRFANNVLQKLYELMDKWSSKYSDQVWVVCESLVQYKKTNYLVDSVYIPNSTVFDPTISEMGKSSRTGNKLAWTGTLLTERQYDIIFGVIENLIKIRSDLEVYLVPIKDHEKFQKVIDERKLVNVKVVKLTSRKTWQKFLSKCDVGLAIYDPEFGSTKYIEPLKIWDFMMCGIPFVISQEPSISQPIIESGVVYLLDKNNTISNRESLRVFLEKDNLESKYDKCLDIAKNFAIDKRIYGALELL